MRLRFLVAFRPFAVRIGSNMGVGVALQRRGDAVASDTCESVRETVERQGVQIVLFEHVSKEHAEVSTQRMDAAARSGERNPWLKLRTFRGWKMETTPGQGADPGGIVQSWQTRVRACVLAGATPIAGIGLRRQIARPRTGDERTPSSRPINAFTRRPPHHMVGDLLEPAGGTALPTDEPRTSVTDGPPSFGDPFVRRAAAEELADHAIEVIRTTGRQPEPVNLGYVALVPNVHQTRWERHDDLLPRYAPVVSIGMAGTVTAALPSGMPLAVVPMNWDTPANDWQLGERLSAGPGPPSAAAILDESTGKCTLVD